MCDIIRDRLIMRAERHAYPDRPRYATRGAVREGRPIHLFPSLSLVRIVLGVGTPGAHYFNNLEEL